MRLDKFLFCFELELGGIIVGFYHLIIYCLLVVATIIAFIYASIYCELKIDLKFHNFNFFRILADHNVILLVVAAVFYIILLVLLIYISWQLILGVEYVRRFRLK